MKKRLLTLAAILCCVSFIACGGKPSAKSLATKWCDLNAKVTKAEGAEKEAAEKNLDAFEKETEKKYENDKAFLKEVYAEVEKCEDASEGRK
jgi:ABC-type glycerol-3-phosphate transport system substrate-binding protein